MTESDITGYGRKMGRMAGITPEGKLDGVFGLQGALSDDGKYFTDGLQIQGTISARTLVPSNTESGGGGGIYGDYAPTRFRLDGKTGNPRADNPTS